MAIAGARVFQGAVGGFGNGGGAMWVSRTRGENQQRFDGIGDLRTGEPIVTVASLALNGEQAAGNEFGEMLAGSLRRDVGGDRQFSGRQSSAAHQPQQNRSSPGIAEKAGGEREVFVHKNIMAPNLFC